MTFFANRSKAFNVLLGLFLVACSLLLCVVADFQPKVVLTVESHPSRRVFGSLSAAEGTPWCNGLPTFWLVGHQGDDETPYCLDAPPPVDFANYDYSNATFTRPRTVVLDTNDTMNAIDGPPKLDRHSCLAIDVNQDGTDDIVCAVGADRGEGHGFNELYLTSPANSSLYKIERHGLQKKPTTRSRLIVPVRGADGSQLVFVAARGTPRTDGKPNVHRMFRLTYAPTPKRKAYFEEVVQGASLWKRNTVASCAVVADLNSDGIDDIVLCNERKRALIFLQQGNGTWIAAKKNGRPEFRNARVADINGDGLPDLIVVGEQRSNSFVRVYAGQSEFPHHFFQRDPWYERKMPDATPDVEVLDVNRDGIPDLYVVQADEKTVGTYCGREFRARLWWGKSSQPPDTFVPPVDTVKDLLLVGTSDGSSPPFEEVFLDHAEPGCGFYVERFGNDHTMILGQGTNGRPGHNLLLQW